MKLFKRLQFAWKYDIEPGFIVVPFGSNTFEYNPVRFMNYEDAEKFTKNEAYAKPQFGKPSVLVIVRKAKV